MNRKWEKFKKSVMYFSAKERKGRLLSCDRNKYLRLQEMSDLELKLTYINLKSEYEHNKMTLVLFFVFVAITVLIGGWGFFESFLKMMEPLSIYYHGSATEGLGWIHDSTHSCWKYCFFNNCIWKDVYKTDLLYI